MNKIFKILIAIIFIAILFFSCGNEKKDEVEEKVEFQYFNSSEYMMLLTPTHVFMFDKSTEDMYPYRISKENNLQHNKTLKPFNPKEETCRIKWTNQQWVFTKGTTKNGLKLIHNINDLSEEDQAFYKLLSSATMSTY